MGFKRVILVEDGSIALEALKKEEVDLVISDSHMPEMNGEFLLQNMRADKNLKDVPFIFLTNVEEKTFKIIGLDGYDGHVLKSSGIEKLRSEIERVLEEKERGGVD